MIRISQAYTVDIIDIWVALPIGLVYFLAVTKNSFFAKCRWREGIFKAFVCAYDCAQSIITLHHL